MKSQKLLLMSFALLLFASCSEDNITGNGPIISETREVNEFHSIRSEISADIYLTQETGQSLRLETNENLMAVIDTRVVNGELIIDSDYNIRNSNRTQIYISAADFRKVTVTGSGTVESVNCMVLNDLELKITGSASIDFCGTAENFTTKISGSGNVNAYGLEAKNVNATITGSGEMRITALEILEVKITGSGSVRYKGSPQVSSTITGSGRILNSN